MTTPETLAGLSVEELVAFMPDGNGRLNDKMGVELDWLRHWWDYYTNALEVDPGVRPSMTQMMAEIDAAPAWTRDTVWARMREGVSAFSGADQLDRWDQHGAWNGVD